MASNFKNSVKGFIEKKIIHKPIYKGIQNLQYLGNLAKSNLRRFDVDNASY